MITSVHISDMQVPEHWGKAVENLQQFVADYKPTILTCVGDELDAPEPSRWNKGLAGEYEPTLQRNIEKTHDIMRGFREALGPDNPFHVSRSNHVDRLEIYIKRYAPAFAHLDLLKIESLLRYDDIDVQYHRSPFEFYKGWYLAHGDEASLSRVSGSTALGLARKFGANVVCGHTHRGGWTHESHGVNGRLQTIWGLEVGCLMDIRKAGYLKYGGANWKVGFGVIHHDGPVFTGTFVPIARDGSFIVDGTRYGA